MKSFERLVLAYLKNTTGPLLDLLQFAYRTNRSVDDAVNMGFQFILQHLTDLTYIRILFVDFSSAFNTIILQNKLIQLSVPTSICQWINSFLTDKQQLVGLGIFSSSTRTISTGAPQGCVLSPLLLSLYTNDCASIDPSVKLLKFSNDTTLIGLIRDGDEFAYRQEVKELVVWCSLNNQAVYDFQNRLVLLRRSACTCGVECLLLDLSNMLITQIKCKHCLTLEKISSD